MKTHMMLAALVGLALAMPVRAEDRARHDASMADLTASYNVQQSEIQNLRDKGWSWNDIGTALAISKRSGQPLQELVAQKDSGMSWGQIADKNGFKLNEVNREAKQVARDFKRADRDAHRGEAVRNMKTAEPRPSDQEARPGDVNQDVTPDRDRVGPGRTTDPTGPRNPTSQGPSYPQNPGGPGDNNSVTPSGNP